MTEVLCIVRRKPTGVCAYISAVQDIDDAFYGYTRRWPADGWMPVAAFEIDREAFTRVTGWDPPLTVPLRAAARVFGNLRISDAAARPFQRRLTQLGAAGVPLFHEWRRAVQAALEVGVSPDAAAARAEGCRTEN